MDDVTMFTNESRELERRLLEAAQALLAHHGTDFALVPFPSRLPARCVAIGELARSAGEGGALLGDLLVFCGALSWVTYTLAGGQFPGCAVLSEAAEEAPVARD